MQTQELEKAIDKNTDYSMNYNSFNGKPVSNETKSDVPYIYCNGKLISDNEYKKMVSDAATANYNSANGK